MPEWSLFFMRISFCVIELCGPTSLFVAPPNFAYTECPSFRTHHSQNSPEPLQVMEYPFLL